MNKQLRIGLFEETPHLLALLRALLLSAGYSVSTCSKEGYPLATFLEELVEELRHPCTSAYDLLIIDVSGASSIGELLAPLEYLVTVPSIPLILLSEEHQQAFELLQAHVAVVPVLFRTLVHAEALFEAIEVTTGVPFPCSVPLLRLVQQRHREHLQATIQAKQAWITTRRKWLSQRQVWLSQRQQWLGQQLVWLEEQRKLPDPQREWLDEQQAWVKQQLDEMNQQQRWLQHHRVFLDQQERQLDQLMLQLPSTNVQ